MRQQFLPKLTLENSCEDIQLMQIFLSKLSEGRLQNDRGIFYYCMTPESCCSVRVGMKDALAWGSRLAQRKLVSGSTGPFNALPESPMMPIICLSLKAKA